MLREGLRGKEGLPKSEGLPKKVVVGSGSHKLRKEMKKAEEAAKAAEAARALVNPAEMFLPANDGAFERSESYGSFDDTGLPLTDAQGEDLSKSARKKLQKQMDKHAKAHDAALASGA